MADAVVSVLLDNLLSILISEGRQLLEFDDQFEETKEELQYMQSYLKEADQVKRRDRNEILKRVMSNLRELVYDAEDVIADCQLLFQKKHKGCAPNFTSYCFLTHLKSRHQLGKRLRKINQGVRKVKENMKSYLQTAPRQPGKYEDGGNMRMTYPILMHEAEMVGLEDDSAKIRKWILEADGPSTVIGIAGMGGIGKTTLAQKICDSASVKNYFYHLAFVTVSRSFKLDELLKKMLGKLNVEEGSMRGKEVRDLLESLNRKLDAKYLVVLDDVWETNEGMWWDSLKSGLPSVEGSCVIVTTRIEEVAKSMGAADRHIHYPQTLSKEDSWSLFSKVAFARSGGKCTNPDLEGLGKEIVARCGGLPLTIKVVGGMMLGKSDSIHEWREISEREELGINKKDELIISRLQLSYEELPTHLKPCFLCFAMFPEDFEINVRDMVNWWIGEGFVWGKNGKTAVEIGKEYFSELCNRFLILGVDKDEWERSYVSCKMHDMVRDMVIRIAREESFFVRLDCGGSQQSRRLGIVGNTAVESIGNSLTKLRTLVGMEIQSIEMIASLKAKLCKVRWLRVLSLSLLDSRLDGDVVCSDWLSGIGSLQHLVYLNIESSSALISLPDSIGNLRNLRILRVLDCPNLKRLPVSITTLEKLTVIEIWLESLECMPVGLGKLSNLERLGWFSPVNKNGSGISELKSLTKLRELWMDIKSVEEIEEGEWINVLSMLQHLQILKLYFDKGISVERDGVVNKIEGELSPPLKSLRELHLWRWPGERTPAWLSPTSLPNLQLLEIWSGRIREMGPRFWDSESGVWKVEVLVLEYLDELEEEWQRMRGAMSSLRLLKVFYCPKLNSFPFDVTYRKQNIWRKEEEDSGLRFKGVAEEEVEEEVECMPEGLGKLSNLERLGWFSPVNKNGSGISELKSLTKLRELWMDIKSVEEIEEGEWINVLSMLQHLQILWLNFGGISVERDGVVNKMEGELSPPLKSLRELNLWNWPGERTPAWLSPTSLPNLQFLRIWGGRIREMGPRFWDNESGVWKVEVLVLATLQEMEEEWQRMRRAMSSLRLLKVFYCPKLNSFPFDVTADIVEWKIWRKEEEDSGLLLKGAAEAEEAEAEAEAGPSEWEITVA